MVELATETKVVMVLVDSLDMLCAVQVQVIVILEIVGIGTENVL